MTYLTAFKYFRFLSPYYNIFLHLYTWERDLKSGWKNKRWCAFRFIWTNMDIALILIDHKLWRLWIQFYSQSLRVIAGDSVDMLIWYWFGAGFWFWLRFSAGFWFGGVVCCFAAWPRLWAPLLGWAPSMLAPILLPSCSFLMCLTTAVALKACCYTQTGESYWCSELRLNLHHVSGCLFTTQTYPPLALSEVFTHLTADRFMDVLAESRVSGNPGGKSDKLFFRHSDDYWDRK